MSDTSLPEVDGAVWRPLAPGDAAVMSALQQVCFEVDGGYRITSSEMREEFDLYGEHADTDSIGAFTAGGELVAAAWSQASTSAATEHRFFIFLLVRPDRRGRGVEDTLLEWIERRARSRSADVDGLPSSLYRYGIYETMTDDLALMERHGFVPARYFTENARNLAGPIPEPGLPTPLQARTWSDAVSADGLAVHNASFMDHWGSQPTTAHAWKTLENEFFVPTASWVVYDGDEPVAYLKSSRYPHDVPDRGRTEAWIEGIGTLRSYRGRGIASALLSMAMLGYRSDGMEFACLGVDAESPTGANRLYERLGFVPEKRWMAFRKGLEEGVEESAGGP
jgi:GNAT superfamily N-acetyltransferase